MKRNLSIILTVIGVVIVVGGLFLYFKPGIMMGPSYMSLSDYYKDLANKCTDSEDQGCCLISVKSMAAGEYKLEPPDGCPNGQERMMTKCLGSYKWCEPPIKSWYPVK